LFLDDGGRDSVAAAHFLSCFLSVDIAGNNPLHFGTAAPDTVRINAARGQFSAPDPRVTPARLLEMYAYINVILLLRKIGAPADIVQELTMKYAGDMYTSAMLYAEDVAPGCSPYDLQVAVDLSLWTPLGLANVGRRNSALSWVGLANVGRRNSALSWEQIHPGWRFARILEAMKKLRGANKWRNYRELGDLLLKKAGLTPLSVCEKAVLEENWKPHQHSIPGKLFEYLFAASDACFVTRAKQTDLYINLGL
jgi:hypothetical protein